MLFWMGSKTYMSKINLQRGKLTMRTGRVERKKRICSEVSVNSPGNPWSQSRRRNCRLWWEGFAEKESFKPGVEEWRGDGWWEWWVDGPNGGSATHTTGWGRIGEISVRLNNNIIIITAYHPKLCHSWRIFASICLSEYWSDLFWYFTLSPKCSVTSCVAY